MRLLGNAVAKRLHVISFEISETERGALLNRSVLAPLARGNAEVQPVPQRMVRTQIAIARLRPEVAGSR